MVPDLEFNPRTAPLTEEEVANPEKTDDEVDIENQSSSDSEIESSASIESHQALTAIAAVTLALVLMAVA